MRMHSSGRAVAVGVSVMGIIFVAVLKGMDDKNSDGGNSDGGNSDGNNSDGLE